MFEVQEIGNDLLIILSIQKRSVSLQVQENSKTLDIS